MTDPESIFDDCESDGSSATTRDMELPIPIIVESES